MQYCRLGVLVLLVAQLGLPVRCRHMKRGEMQQLARSYRSKAQQPYVPHEFSGEEDATNAVDEEDDEAVEVVEGMPNYMANDYSFLPDRMPDLADDEYAAADEHNTPFTFLKQNEELTQLPMTTPYAEHTPGSPIYITVPIFINTVGQPPEAFHIDAYPEYAPMAHNGLEGSTLEAGPAPFEGSPRGEPTSQYNRLLRNYRQLARGLQGRQFNSQPMLQHLRIQLQPQRRVVPKAKSSATNYNFNF